MSYQTMADALLTMLRAKATASTYVTSANSSAKSDWGLIDREGPLKIIITPGEAPRSTEGESLSGQYVMDWNMDVHVVADVKGRPIDTHDALVTAANAIITTLDLWPFLNGTAGVELAFHQGWQAPVDLFDAAGNGPHVTDVIIPVIVREQTTFTELE